MRIVFWGIYDTGKPRTRILLDGLRQNGVELIECHTDLWSEVEDKSRIKHWRERFKFLFLWLFSYPKLIWRYWQLPAHDAVVVGYPGQLDVLILWPFARLRGVPMVLDLVQSLYATVVDIRQMVSPRHPLARFLFGLEWLAFHVADRVVFLSDYAASDFGKRFGLTSNKTGSVMIGAEPGFFSAKPILTEPRKQPFTVLFYGSFHKLHGIDTIIEAAQLARDQEINWVVIGQGQEEGNIQALLDAHPLPRLRWIRWVEYNTLIDWLHNADVALGLIGRENQTGWAVPNKVFQILTTGVPLINADTPAIRELVSSPAPGIRLIRPGDASALLTAVNEMIAEQDVLSQTILHRTLLPQFQPKAIGQRFIAVIQDAISQRKV